MRYHQDCGIFSTKRWYSLWQNNIKNLESLKRHAERGAAFVAMDAEPWSEDRNQISEIGLTFLPKIDALGEAPNTIASLREQHPVQVHRILISGRQLQPGRNDKRERQLDGVTVCIVDPDAVGEVLLGLLQSFQAQVHPSTLILTGFALAFELKKIVAAHPDMSKHVSHWVDIQELMKDVSTQTSVSTPGKRGSLIAFGFGDDHEAVKAPRNNKHNAANDTVRVIALLAKLLALSLEAHEDTPALEIKCFPRGQYNPFKNIKRLRQKNLFVGRPSPKEKFPFMARIRVQGGGSRNNGLGMRELSKVFPTYKPRAVPFTTKIPSDGPNGFGVQELAKIFPAYEPTAVGYKRNRLTGWLAFSSRKELDDFVGQVDGSETGNGDGSVWEVVSQLFFGENSPLVTASDVTEHLRAKAEAAVEAKKEVRRRKKEEQIEREVGDSWDCLFAGI